MPATGAHRAQAPGRRLRRLLASAGIIAAATVLGLLAAGGTNALLSANRAIPAAATVTAGSLELTINGAGSTPLGAFAPIPGLPVAHPFTVTNTGTTPAELTVTITAATSQTITGHTQARITPVPDSGACTVNLTGPQAPLNGYTTAVGRVPAGNTVVLCLEIALEAATPTTVAGQTISFTTQVTAQQGTR